MRPSWSVFKIAVLESAAVARWQLCPVGSSIGTRIEGRSRTMPQKSFAIGSVIFGILWAIFVYPPGPTPFKAPSPVHQR
jgi:hypothetical protein